MTPWVLLDYNMAIILLKKQIGQEIFIFVESFLDRIDFNLYKPLSRFSMVAFCHKFGECPVFLHAAGI